MELAAGTQVTDKIRLIEQIGQGGMGSVWSAEHTGLQTTVAVKFIDAELAEQHPELRVRFQREAAVSAQIRSVHIVQCFDHGETADGIPYIVMELLEGESLGERLKRDGACNIHEVALIVDQVCKLLHRAHTLGIVHRDLKPDNIFLLDSEYDLFVKVLDFGIAKTTQADDSEAKVTKVGAVVGTPEFMSPEQALNSADVDHGADIWSLGVLAYYALTRRLPFRRKGDTPMWLRMSRGDFRPISSRIDPCPEGLDDWFTTAFQPNPENRFHSVGQMTQELIGIVDQFLRAQTPGAEGLRPSTVPDEVPPSSRRKPPAEVGEEDLLFGPIGGDDGDALAFQPTATGEHEALPELADDEGIDDAPLGDLTGLGADDIAAGGKPATQVSLRAHDTIHNAESIRDEDLSRAPKIEPARTSQTADGVSQTAAERKSGLSRTGLSLVAVALLAIVLGIGATYLTRKRRAARTPPGTSATAATTASAAPSASAIATAAPIPSAEAGFLHIAAEGGYCNVTVNARPAGATPVTSARVRAGKVDVACFDPTGKKHAKQVQVPAAGSASVTFKLE